MDLKKKIKCYCWVWRMIESPYYLGWHTYYFGWHILERFENLLWITEYITKSLWFTEAKNAKEIKLPIVYLQHPRALGDHGDHGDHAVELVAVEHNGDQGPVVEEADHATTGHLRNRVAATFAHALVKLALLLLLDIFPYLFMFS